MSKNYRSKDVSHQYHLIAKAFKKFLLKSNPEPVFSHGYIPVWTKKSHKSVIADFEYIHRDCYVLPRAGTVSFRSILNGIRREKPLLVYEYKDQEGSIVTKPISSLTEAELIKSLKNLSLVLYANEDEKKWIHFEPTGEANIILLADQLKPAGRLGQIPLKALLNKFVSSVFRGYGKDGTNHDMIDFEKQLLNEHRIPTADVNAIHDTALSLVATVRSKDPGLTIEYKLSQKQNMKNMINALCDDVMTGKKTRILPPTPIRKNQPTPDEINLVELQMRKDQEADNIIRQAAKLLHDPRRTQQIMDNVTAKRGQLVNDYDYTKEQADRAIRDALWKLKFPNSK